MANVPFSALHDLVLPYLPGAELGLVNAQIRKVVREFMKRTTIVRETFVFDSAAGVSTYKLTPTFGQVSAIIDAYPTDDPNRPLKVITEETRIPAAAARPRGWFTVIPDLLNLYPQPDEIYSFTVNAVVTLKQDDNDLPEELVAQYGEALAAGVLATMYSMPGKPWTQSQAAKESGRIFNGVIRTLRGQLRDGGQPNQSTIRGVARFGA